MRRSIFELLECRRLFAGLGDPAPLPPPSINGQDHPASAPGLQAAWNVSFVDPTSAYTSYYADITRTLQAAGKEWGQLFDTTASIEISVSFSTVLTTASARSATSAFVYTDTTNNINIFEQGAAAELNTGLDANGSSPDIELFIGVNPSNNFLTGKLWFDPDPQARTAAIPAGKVDAFSVFLHELGHAIAYNGWADWTTGDVPSNYASTFDEYILNNNGHNYFTGSFANENYGADPALTDGNVYHWGNAAGPSADLVGQLMNGVSFANQTRYDISSLDVAVMNDVGMILETNQPVLTSRNYDFNTTGQLILGFDESVRSSLQLSDLTLNRVSAGGVTTIQSSQMQLNYDRKNNVAAVSFAGLLADGNYVLSLDAAGISDLAGNGMIATGPYSFFVLGADGNRDRKVDTADFNLLAASFGQNGKTFSQGNFNYAGGVDSEDFNLFLSQYGKTLPPPAASPLVAASLFSPSPAITHDLQGLI